MTDSLCLFFMTQLDLVQYLVNSGVLQTPSLIAAFEMVDRADFVREDVDPEEIYSDFPLPIGQEQTISQPTTVAIMLEMLQPRVGDKILDVGSGSGWTTALLAQVVGERGQVCGVELVPDLAQFGRTNIAKYRLPWASIVAADHTLGLPAEAPFDRILVSASGDVISDALVAQLAVDGVMVVPVKTSLWKVVKRADGRVDKKEFPGFIFVPLRH